MWLSGRVNRNQLLPFKINKFRTTSIVGAMGAAAVAALKVSVELLGTTMLWHCAAHAVQRLVPVDGGVPKTRIVEALRRAMARVDGSDVYPKVHEKFFRS